WACRGGDCVRPTLVEACAVGAVVGGVRKVITGRSVLPFGPFLCLGGAVWHLGIFPTHFLLSG
ncbi:MAG: hypothetical protein LUC93_10455, partial [Planctomycetaceae bacterium]|nr:hypothetical protein [Planctomycetaceae bacterium]